MICLRQVPPHSLQMSWRLRQRMTTPPRKRSLPQQRRFHYRQSTHITSYIGMCSTWMPYQWLLGNLMRRASAPIALRMLLLLIFLSYELEHAHPEVAQTLNAGFQTLFERPVDFSDVCCFPSIGANAYNAEEITWYQATIEFLGDQLSEEGLLKRCMPVPHTD